ncbi:Arabinose operon regulatory protein [compost metagenome]
MEKACELLRESDHKVSDIAELVGYENQRYFSQVFKKFTGQTPSEFRESPLPVTPPAKN